MAVTKTGGARKARPNLRDAQKAFTRQRILAAARDLFYRRGYYATTVDEIVTATGASRPTFYLHFADKEDILATLTTEYAARVAVYLERLPGPLPSLAEVRAWLVELAEFIEGEKASISLLGEVSSHTANVPNYVAATIDALMTSLSRRSPAFAAGRRNDRAGMEARARAEVLLLEITWAATTAWKEKGSRYGETAITVVARALHSFMNDPRYAGAAKRKG